MREKLAAILRSIALELSCLKPGEAILAPPRRSYDRRKKNDFAAGSLSTKNSTALIIELTKCRPLTTIALDALDECNFKERHKLLDVSTEILQGSTGLIKTFVPSRDDQDLVCHLASVPNLRIEADIYQPDIVRFVLNEVDQLIEKKRHLYGEVSEALHARSTRHCLMELMECKWPYCLFFELSIE